MRSSITNHHSQRVATRRGTRWGAILAVMAALVTAFAVAASARSHHLAPPTGPPQAGIAPPRGGTVGPTPNITKVANAITVHAKSLTTLVKVLPGLALTKPVTISIAYYSPAGSKRITQSYVASTGNRFLYNDREGDGKPRQMNIDITLEETKPGGGVYTFTVPGKVVLDPLYDVTISPLKFSLIENCDLVGLSEIRLNLLTPDGGQEVKFNTKAGRPPISFGQFAWARTEVSASAQLHRPYLTFYESDYNSLKPGSLPPPFVNLVPGKTQTLAYNVKDIFKDCRAYVQYTITYKLRWYPYLSP